MNRLLSANSICLLLVSSLVSWIRMQCYYHTTWYPSSHSIPLFCKKTLVGLGLNIISTCVTFWHPISRGIALTHCIRLTNQMNIQAQDIFLMQFTLLHSSNQNLYQISHLPKPTFSSWLTCVFPSSSSSPCQITFLLNTISHQENVWMC